MGQTTSNCSSPETIEIEILKKWSGFDDFTLIFDSDAHGNGFESLEKTVINKCNLYFIAFDDHENVFGGYVDTYVDKVNKYINDSNAFVFSLFREGELRNEKYQIKKEMKQKHLYSIQIAIICLYLDLVTLLFLKLVIINVIVNLGLLITITKFIQLTIVIHICPKSKE